MIEEHINKVCFQGGDIGREYCFGLIELLLSLDIFVQVLREMKEDTIDNSTASSYNHNKYNTSDLLRFLEHQNNHIINRE